MSCLNEFYIEFILPTAQIVIISVIFHKIYLQITLYNWSPVLPNHFRECAQNGMKNLIEIEASKIDQDVDASSEFQMRIQCLTRKSFI